MITRIRLKKNSKKRKENSTKYYQENKTKILPQKKEYNREYYQKNETKILPRQIKYNKNKKMEEDRIFFEQYGHLPEKKQLSKFEHKWRSILTKKYFPFLKFECGKKNLKWLVNPKTNCFLEIDIYFPDQKVAIEVQGEQHFKFTRGFHNTYEDFEKQQYRDQLKRDLCKQNGIVLIEIARKDKDLDKITEIASALYRQGSIC